MSQLERSLQLAKPGPRRLLSFIYERLHLTFPVGMALTQKRIRVSSIRLHTSMPLFPLSCGFDVDKRLPRSISAGLGQLIKNMATSLWCGTRPKVHSSKEANATVSSVTTYILCFHTNNSCFSISMVLMSYISSASIQDVIRVYESETPEVARCSVYGPCIPCQALLVPTACRTHSNKIERFLVTRTTHTYILG